MPEFFIHPHRSDVEEEFRRLIKNKELTLPKKDNFDIPRLQLTDYNASTPSLQEQQHYVDQLLHSQVI